MTATTRFIQIHWLASYPAALLNRDEAGLAKRIPFGGATRARISSQCLKRHWRLAGQDNAADAARHPWALSRIGIPMGSRSKEIVERSILPAAQRDLSPSEELVNAVRGALLTNLYGKSAEKMENRQALFFGEPEIEYLTTKARAALELADAKAAKAYLDHFFKEERKNMNALKHGAGLESALFGRMVTSDPSANRDAAVHVAHALTVHAMEQELDFMTVVDDLKHDAGDSDAGAAGIFDMELVSGVYYGYAVIDVPLLLSNLTGNANAAGKVVEHLIHLIADVSPGAKKGSTAPYSYAEFMLVEAGDRQPRTLANAFRAAVPLRGDDIGARAIERLASYLAKVDEAYGSQEQRRQLSILETEVANVKRTNLDALAAFAQSQVNPSTTA